MSRFVTLRRLSLSVIVAALLAALLPGSAAVASGYKESGVKPPAFTKCPDVFFYGIRGSGQSKKNDGKWTGHGDQVRLVAQSMDKAMRARPAKTRKTIFFGYNDYWAVNAVKSTNGQYRDSVNQGVSRGLTDVRSIVKKCGTKTRLVIVGYSQGAQVAHIMASRLTHPQDRFKLAKERDRVARVVLISDPARFVGDKNVTFKFYKHTSGAKSANGYSYAKDNPQRIGAKYKGKVRDFCSSQDYICSRAAKKTDLAHHIAFYKRSNVVTDIRNSIMGGV